MQSRAICVLLIEDASDLRQLNEQVLKEFGYRVGTISPSEDPVSAAVRTRPDVIVLRIRSNEPHDWDILDPPPPKPAPRRRAECQLRSEPRQAACR